METFDAAEAGTQELDPGAREALLADPLARLEHGGEDKRRAMASFERIQALQEESRAKQK